MYFQFTKKNGPKEDSNNYRPILPTISKFFEKHIASHLHSYIYQTNIIHESQPLFIMEI
jgi:hypothetical protein